MMSRDRSNSPVFRSRSRSPREWKRPERRGADRDRGADRQSSRDPHGKVRLYISNLPYDIRWQDLKDLFREKVGSDVYFTQLYEGPDGKPSGSGVVEVRGKDVAEKAIDLLHRYEIKGRSIIVREEREKDRLRHEHQKGDNRGMDNSSSGKPSLMSGAANLLGAMGNANMMNMLSSGSMMGGLGGSSFNMQVLSQLGIELSCITNQVFVANLDYKVTVAKLEEIFKIAGNVIEVDLKTDKEGKSRGMGTVRFEHPIEAVQAIALFNGQYLYERQMGVRMDKWVDPIMQDIPRRLPVGLKGVGIGLGTNGQPLLNIGEIANTLTLSILTGQLTPANLGMLGTNMAALSGMGMNVAAMGSNLLGLGGGMTSMGGSISGMMGGVSGLGSGLGGSSSGVGSGLGMMSSSGLGGGGGSSSGLGGSLSSPLGGLSSSLGMRGGLGESSYLSKGSGGSGLAGLGSSGLGGLSDNRMSSMSGGDLYGSLTSLGYDRGGNLDRIGSSFDRGLDRSDSYGKSSDNSTIFVKNLPYSFTWQNLVDKFGDCGDIKFAEIKMDNGRSRGCGIVQFLSSDSARRAISLMNGARVDGRQIEVRLDRVL